VVNSIDPIFNFEHQASVILYHPAAGFCSLRALYGYLSAHAIARVELERLLRRKDV
jgi:hypothetical protein